MTMEPYCNLLPLNVTVAYNVYNRKLTNVTGATAQYTKVLQLSAARWFGVIRDLRSQSGLRSESGCVVVMVVAQSV